MGILGIVDTVVFAAIGAATKKSVELPKTKNGNFQSSQKAAKIPKTPINQLFQSFGIYLILNYWYLYLFIYFFISVAFRPFGQNEVRCSFSFGLVVV